MTTQTKIAANRRNAQFSTGPKTEAGLAVTRLNAVSHGLRAADPVVPGECADEWQAFRTAMIADLAPVGALEGELAERVAVLSWRLRRVSDYEAGTVARASDRSAHRVGEEMMGPEVHPDLVDWFKPPATLRERLVRLTWAIKQVERCERRARRLAELASAPDGTPVNGADASGLLYDLPDFLPSAGRERLPPEKGPLTDPACDPRSLQFLRDLGLPEELEGEPERWGGWTAGVVRLGVERVAAAVGWTGQQLLDEAARKVAADLADRQQRWAKDQRAIEADDERVRAHQAAARRRALVPAEGVVNVVLRYETHLQKQLTATLHELERRQALRSSYPPQPPIVVDVTHHEADGIAALGGLGG